MTVGLITVHLLISDEMTRQNDFIHYDFRQTDYSK